MADGREYYRVRAELRITELEAERDAYRNRTEALGKLISCYQVQTSPSEKLHRELERTRNAINAFYNKEK